MREQFPPITINFAPVKVIGIPGLSLVAIAVAIVLEFPVGRWLLASGILGGVLVAVALILARRKRGDSDDDGHGRLLEGLTPDRPRARSHESSARFERGALKFV